jgi:hypothetical protein
MFHGSKVCAENVHMETPRNGERMSDPSDSDRMGGKSAVTAAQTPAAVALALAEALAEIGSL